MLTDDELKRLFEDLESDRVERKESIDPKKVQQAICDFANDMPGHKQPGVLFIGVKDDGTCAGITIDDQLLLNLSQLRSTGNILPLPSMTVQKKTINSSEVAVVVVESSTLPPVRFKGRTWIRVPDYPMVAIQQILRNAVMHRSYETTNAPTRLMWFNDRVEILSPGGPYGVVTVENFGRPGEADYRNPTIAEAMRNLGFVQKFGAGIQTARDALADNGNPPLQLDPQATFVSVTLRKRGQTT